MTHQDHNDELSSNNQDYGNSLGSVRYYSSNPYHPTWDTGGWHRPVSPAFEGEVRSILRKHCLTCHNPEQPRGDLDLSSYAGILAGGISGKGVVAGKSDASLLYTLVAHLEDPAMPPNKPKISQREIDTRPMDRWQPVGASRPHYGQIFWDGDCIRIKIETFPFQTHYFYLQWLCLGQHRLITALATSPTAPLLAAPGYKQILIWNLSDRRLLGGLPFSEGEVHTLRFSRDGRILIAVGG